MGFGLSFGIMGVIFPIAFLMILSVFIVALFRSLRTWQKNNASPVLTVEAVVRVKRHAVDRHTHHHHTGTSGHFHPHSSYSNTYYATFEVESGDRIELSVPAHEFGLLAEGDRGRLTFQGTRFHSFERDRRQT